MAVQPGRHSLGKFLLSVNSSHAVVIWCEKHREWVTGANSSRHFVNRLLHPESSPKGGSA